MFAFLKSKNNSEIQTPTSKLPEVVGDFVHLTQEMIEAIVSSNAEHMAKNYGTK